MNPERRQALLAASPFGRHLLGSGFAAEFAGEWNPDDHPRGDAGRFAPAGTVGATPAPGDEADIPPLDTRRAFRVRFHPGETPGTLGIGYADDGHVRTSMPAASARHFLNDLRGVVDVPPDSGNAAVDAVASGRGELLGKGNDGLVFAVGDRVVKVSTTVPYQPFNPGHRTPAEAAEKLARQTAVNNALVDAGVPGLLRQELVRHGDKAFAVRDKLQLPKRLTPEQVAAVRRTMDAIHEQGYVVGDTVQVGVRDGKPYLFDLGNATRAHDENDYRDDSDQFERFADAHGGESLPLARAARTRLTNLTESRGFMPETDRNESVQECRRGLAASEAAKWRGETAGQPRWQRVEEYRRRPPHELTRDEYESLRKWDHDDEPDRDQEFLASRPAGWRERKELAPLYDAWIRDRYRAIRDDAYAAGLPTAERPEWTLRQADYVNRIGNDAEEHAAAVHHALAAGRPVPPAVVRDYQKFAAEHPEMGYTINGKAAPTPGPAPAPQPEAPMTTPTTTITPPVHENLVEYTVRDCFKKKVPMTAGKLLAVSKAVAKKFDGSSNMFLGGSVSVTPEALNAAVLNRIAESALEAATHVKPGMGWMMLLATADKFKVVPEVVAAAVRSHPKYDGTANGLLDTPPA